jgi:hypothetical protein
MPASSVTPHQELKYLARMAGPLQVLEEKLRRYPALDVERGDGFIRACPQAEDGFRVELRVNGQAIAVFMEGWHEDFEHADEALECFALGLSDRVRLRVVSRGKLDCAWTLETLREGAWVPDSTTGLLLFPFWIRSAERYLQNRLVKTATP